MLNARKAVVALTRCGGVADTSTLRDVTSAHALKDATRRGWIVRDARGRYALPAAHEGRRAANRLSAVLSHASAAAHWGWEMKTVPTAPTVTVPRTRRVDPGRRAGVDVRWRDLPEVVVADGLVTSRIQTVVDCARDLPFDEALAIADSALRHADVHPAELLGAADRVKGKGAIQCRRVAEHADARAANPFESVLRAIALDVPGLRLVPQVPIAETGFFACPDLVDTRRRLVVEADSFEFHGTRKAHVMDCARYTNLVARGWTVMRFAWEQVMFRPDWVRACLKAVAESLVEHAPTPK